MEFYRRNYIEGLFLSSGIIVSPTHTMQLLLETVRMLRLVYHFNGYIHVKGIPGADPSVIEETGWYVDRMSVNLELATAEALKRPQHSFPLRRMGGLLRYSGLMRGMMSV